MWTMYFICTVLLILYIIRRICLKICKRHKNVCILVLGDLGRSPRMQYHVTSFAKEGFTVDLIGYPGSLPLKEIRENAQIRIHYLSPPPRIENKLNLSLCYIIKALWQGLNLLWILFYKHISTHMLVQNPPAIPTLPICWIYCVIMDAQFIIDWHNYAFTLMGLNLRQDHIFVKSTKIIEAYFGSQAHYNFCVSKAMKKDLQLKWRIKAEVLYDRPTNEFHPITLREKHLFLMKLSDKYCILKGQKENTTIFTECIENEIRLSSKRPGFIVSSTSWTEDEDFSILINALQEYENIIVQGICSLPDLICVITGKGPLKEFYVAIIELKNWKHITVITPWLENEDYPKILACADLGICLHMSSSGLDLPMKVVDMFGCELPVCAYNFECLSELVKHEQNGMIFSNERELTSQLKTWFENFPHSEVHYELDTKFRKELNKFKNDRWHDNWTSVVLPYFKQ